MWGACARDPRDSRYFAGFFRSPRVAFLADSFVVFLQFIQLFVRELFHVNQLVTGRMVRADQLMELEMYGFGVTVLGVLDQKHHQRSNDGGAGVDDELPRIRVMEDAA